MGSDGNSIFRRIVARANYLSQDRSDIRFAVKELSRHMSKPRVRDVSSAKRLARYLVAKPTMICHFRRQDKPQGIEGWSDSDWAGCLETRKSTSGGLIRWGSHIPQLGLPIRGSNCVPKQPVGCHGLHEPRVPRGMLIWPGSPTI